MNKDSFSTDSTTFNSTSLYSHRESSPSIYTETAKFSLKSRLCLVVYSRPRSILPTNIRCTQNIYDFKAALNTCLSATQVIQLTNTDSSEVRSFKPALNF